MSLIFSVEVSRSSSTPAFSNYSSPRGNPATMSVSADSTPSPRIMKPSATRVPREPESSTPKTPGKFNDMSCVVRKLAFCICENKDADQLRGNRKADQRLCFR